MKSPVKKLEYTQTLFLVFLFLQCFFLVLVFLDFKLEKNISVVLVVVIYF